jgi:hypothetical protein
MKGHVLGGLRKGEEWCRVMEAKKTEMKTYTMRWLPYLTLFGK